MELRPDPATNPYPTRCSGENPFTLGAVWGIQAGWDAAVQDQPTTGLTKLKAGKYSVTAAVDAKYQKLFGIPANKATAKINVTIKDVKFDDKGLAAASAAASSSAGAHAERAGPQVSS